jgi:hypothetical protein
VKRGSLRPTHTRFRYLRSLQFARTTNLATSPLSAADCMIARKRPSFATSMGSVGEGTGTRNSVVGDPNVNSRFSIRNGTTVSVWFGATWNNSRRVSGTRRASRRPQCRRGTCRGPAETTAPRPDSDLFRRTVSDPSPVRREPYLRLRVVVADDLTDTLVGKRQRRNGNVATIMRFEQQHRTIRRPIFGDQGFLALHQRRRRAGRV